MIARPPPWPVVLSLSLRVLAGLAGISKSRLSRIERGERALDNRSETVALANALQISPSELIGLPVSVPGDGHTDVAIRAVRAALMAVSHHQPAGRCFPWRRCGPGSRR